VEKTAHPEQFHILREKGTERAFSGIYDNHHEHGIYRCAACGLDLYRSEDKYDSGTGWPSFTAPVAAENVITKPDNTFSCGVLKCCAAAARTYRPCFDDGPKPTGLLCMIHCPAIRGNQK
jgi:peptide-methionine (R)-S-oxide reductase